jgi:hypothetical protein
MLLLGAGTIYESVLPEAKRGRGRFNQSAPCPWFVLFSIVSAGRDLHFTIIALTQPQEVVMPVRSFFVVILLIFFFSPVPVLGKSELPHEFGERVPLYPSAQAVETRYTRDSVRVRFATGDSFERVSGFYENALEEAGWLILPATSIGVIKAEKIESGKDDIELSIKEASAMSGHPSGFIIDLYYPGGRE